MIITEILYFIFFITILNLVTGFKKSNILGCGLVGFSSSENNTFSKSLVKILLWHNSQTRGKHATGIFTPSTGIIKDSKEAKDFFKLEIAKSFIDGDNVLMGHVRHATVGNSGDPLSAHPWDFGDIVMMHNGTLKNHEEIASNYGFKKEDWKVDSQVLGMALQEDFKTNAFKVLADYNGAAAVVLFHKKRESLFVYRDTERPLYYGYLGDNDDNMYISSLEDILEIIDCKNIKQFEPFKVHEIKNGKIISKMPIKRKMATWNKFTKKLVSSVKEIISYKRYNLVKTTLTGIFTGFEPSVVKAQFLENYQVRSIVDVADNSPLAKLTKGKYYKVIKVYDDSKFSVLDDKNTVKEVFISMVDHTNFIPISGGYVICTMANVNADFQKDKMYEVMQHTFGSDELVVKNHETNETSMGLLSNFRTASEEEIENYFKGTNDCNCSINTKVITLPVVVNKVVESDLPFDEPEIIESTIDTAVDEEINKDDLTSLITENQNIALKLSQEAIEEIYNSYYKTGSVAIYHKINRLKVFLNKCNSKNTNFILNINNNSYKNLELV